MTATSDPRRLPLFTLTMVLACAALAVLVVVLSRQNRQLKADLAALDTAIQRSRDALKPGEKLAPLTVADADGVEIQLPLDAPGRRLLLIGSTQCPACAAAKPYWVELGAAAVPANIGTVCVMTDGPVSRDDEAALTMPVLLVRGFRDSSIARVPSVPAVLLVRDGVVERLWPGPFDTHVRDEIKRAMAAG